MPLYYEPTEAQLDEIEAKAKDASGSDAKLAENHVWFGLFNRDLGIYKDKQPANLWVRGEDGSLLRIKCKMSRREWIEKFFTIKPKGKPLCRMVLNAPQRKLEAMCLRMERAGLPVRIIILKARQMGFCLSPDTKILTADLRWVRIDDVHVGDELVATDENSGVGRGNGRKMRTCVVQAKAEIEEEAFEIVFDDGRRITATGQHRFLSHARGGTACAWRRVEDFRVGDDIRYVTKPWGESSLEDAWYGGILDGEGSMKRTGNRSSLQITASQRGGSVWNRMLAYIRSRGHSHHVTADSRSSGQSSKLGSDPVYAVTVTRMNEMFQLLGQCRPVRFLERRWWEGRDLPGKRSGEAWARIVSITPVGRRRMVDLQTSTKTFIAEGLVSHNSTYVQSLMFWLNLTGQKLSCLILADVDERAEMLLKMANTALSSMPRSKDESWDFKMSSRAAYAIVWGDPIGSSINIASAQKKAAGRGGTRDAIHITETAFYPEDADPAGVLESLPDLPGTYGFNESTANGDTGWFRNEFWSSWDEREKPISGRSRSWVSMFFAWWEYDDYRWSRTFGLGQRFPHSMESEILSTLSEEEEWLLKQRYFRRWRPDDAWEQVTTREEVKLDVRTMTTRTVETMRPRKKWRRVGPGWLQVTPDQLAWRRKKIEDALPRGGKVIFDQENPGKPIDAFRATGRKVFDPEMLDRLLAKAAKPLWIGNLEEPTEGRDPEDPSVEPVLTSRG